MRTSIIDQLGDVEELAQNIVSVLELASDEDWRNGSEWYEYAHWFALSLFGGNLHKSAGVIAALSPQKSWHENVKLARYAYRDRKASGQVRQFVRKANEIIAGHAPCDVLGGNKVRAFYSCIVDPHGTQAVVIDRHAISLALSADKRAACDAHYSSGCVKALERAGAYEHLSAAYRLAAQHFGIKPHQAQAISWIVWRKLKRSKDSSFTRFEVDIPALPEYDDFVGLEPF